MATNPNVDIDEFRAHFQDLYIRAIPQLLNESGLFLAFVSMLVATDTLAGLWQPNRGSGERFRGFIAEYFPPGLRERSSELWQLRNLMIHSANPGAFALCCGSPDSHLVKFGEAVGLNADDFYVALQSATQDYFKALEQDDSLKANFRRRVAAKDGGAPDQYLLPRP